MANLNHVFHEFLARGERPYRPALKWRDKVYLVLIEVADNLVDLHFSVNVFHR